MGSLFAIVEGMKITFYRNKVNRLMLLLFLLIAACAQKLEPETPCNFVQNSQLQRVSWKGRVPVVLYITSSVPEEYHESIRVAASEWNYRLGRFMIDVRTGGPAAMGKDETSAIYWMNTWDAGKELEQARTTIFWKGSMIHEADIRVNARDFNYSVTDVTDPSKVDFESLMVHEIGHVLGLQHVEQGKGSVMESQLAHGTERRVPGNVDMESLKCEY